MLLWSKKKLLKKLVHRFISQQCFRHIPNRWSVSGRTVASVSTLRLQEYPPSSQSIEGVSVLFWGFAGWVCTSCHLWKRRWEEWWLFWFPVLIHPSSVDSWETLPVAGQMWSSCLTVPSVLCHLTSFFFNVFWVVLSDFQRFFVKKKEFLKSLKGSSMKVKV